MIDNTSASKFGVVSRTTPTGRHKHTQAKYITSSLTGSGTTSTGLSFSNPVYELSNPSAGESSIDCINKSNESLPTTSSPPNVAFKVEHVLTPNFVSGHRFANFRSALDSRCRVAQAIYPYMVCIALAYCVTLSLYPGIEAEIRSCRLQTWMPVLLMLTFNSADVVGKVLASLPYAWSRRQLILLSTVRIVLIPLLLLCCAPRSQPIISGEAPPFIFTLALGVTNGLAGSLPMMLAPAKVPATLKEVTGNMMTLSYNVGLSAGSLIGYLFDSMLGPPINKPCPTFPFAPMTPLTNINITAINKQVINATLNLNLTTASSILHDYTTTAVPVVINKILTTITTTVSTLVVSQITNATTTTAIPIPNIDIGKALQINLLNNISTTAMPNATSITEVIL